MLKKYFSGSFRHQNICQGTWHSRVKFDRNPTNHFGFIKKLPKGGDVPTLFLAAEKVKRFYSFLFRKSCSMNARSLRKIDFSCNTGSNHICNCWAGVFQFCRNVKCFSKELLTCRKWFHTFYRIYSKLYSSIRYFDMKVSYSSK